MQLAEHTTKAGCLYVLIHPSNQNLYKIGQTTRHPEERLAEHNSRYEKYTGQIVKETGQKWELKTYISVLDPIWAENAFWGATVFADIPYRGGVEVEHMEWEEVQKGLDAAKNAGLRPPPDQSLPDYVFAYRAWMNKRLKGRGIMLVGHIKSKWGKADFRCSKSHEWRAKPEDVAEGEGCPKCGLGEKNPEEIRKTINVGVICLLTHPDKPGVIKIGLTHSTLKECYEEGYWDGWEAHRYRNVEEPDLAELLVWELLGYPQPNDREEINIDLGIAEQAFRDLHPRMQSKIILAEKAKDNVI